MQIMWITTRTVSASCAENSACFGPKRTWAQVSCTVSVGITVDAPVTAVWNKTNDIQYFEDI